MSKFDWEFDDVFDIGAEKDAYIVVKWVVNLFSDRIMKTVVWYTRNAIFDVYDNYQTANDTFGTLANWKTFAISIATGSGAGFGWLPFILLPADVAALLDGMLRSSFGVGSILAKEYGFGPSVLDRDDFIDVIAIWAGVPEFVGDEQAKQEILDSYMAGKTVNKVGAKAAVKLTVKATVKVVTKFSAKIAAQIAALAPWFGAAGNSGINAYYMVELVNAAETYYRDKFSKMKQDS